MDRILNFYLGIKHHNAEDGCQKCETKGEFSLKFRTMSFPRINVTSRTDDGFRRRLIPEHHREYSIIEQLPIDMIKDFVVADSLHLFHLGIMKKCLLIWLEGGGTFEFKWEKKDISAVNSLLTNCKNNMPTDIHRSIRNLDCIRFWKGTEFRTFLMYLGIVILKKVLRKEEYEHFRKLFCAVTICSNDRYLKRLIAAKECFEEYIEEYTGLYGMHAISSNVHNLSHVVEDVKRFGNLTKIDSYPFENALYGLKLKVRTCNKPLEQICRRIIEFDSGKNVVGNEKNENNEPELKYFSENKITKELFYSYVSFSSSFLSTKKFGDSWFLTKDGKVAQFHHARKSNGNIFVNGSCMNELEIFFEDPFDSKFINIYCAKNEKLPAIDYAYENIKCKLMCIHNENDLVFIPILHTLK